MEYIPKGYGGCREIFILAVTAGLAHLLSLMERIEQTIWVQKCICASGNRHFMNAQQLQKSRSRTSVGFSIGGGVEKKVFKIPLLDFETQNC